MECGVRNYTPLRSVGVSPVRARTGQFAGVAPLRSALHSYRTFTTRGLYFIDRLHSYRTFTTRGLYFIDRYAGVLFPDTLIPNAAYEVSLRVRSERSKRLRELTPAARRSRSILN